MTHDPLCLASGKPTTWEPEMCVCDLIAKVEARATPDHFRERIERLITKAYRWRYENVELRKQLKGQP